MDDEDVREDPNDPGHARLPVDDLRALRKAAKERKDMESQLNANNRELAFARAKLDIEDPKLKYFIKGYEGELTPEAIRAQAQTDGFIQAEQPPPPPQTDPDRRAVERLARASSGANDTPAPELGDLIRQANTPEEVMKLMVQAGYPTTWNRQEDY